MINKRLEKLSKVLFAAKLYKLTNFVNKLIGFLYENKKNLYYIYKFYLRKKNYNEDFLKKIFPPNFFLIKNVNFDKNILISIKNYQNTNPTNDYDYHGHTNVYQSMHDLNIEKDFIKTGDLIKNIIKEKVIPYYSLNNIELILEKLWFTITKKSGKMKKHHHLDGELSGVLYIKCEKSENSGCIKLHNYSQKMNCYVAESPFSEFVHSEYKEKIYKHRPKIGDLIVFDSYVDHEVDNSEQIKDERISMPWDIKINFEK